MIRGSAKVVLCLFLACGSASAEIIQAPAVELPVTVKLDAIPTGSLVTTLMRDIMGVPYVIAPDVLADRKPISVNLRMPPSDVPVKVVRFLRGIGLTVTLQDGTVYVTKGPLSQISAPQSVGSFGPTMIGGNQIGPSGELPAVPSGSPVDHYAARTASRVSGGAPGAMSPGPVALDVPGELLIVEPAHRSPAELAEVLRTVLPGLIIAQRGDVAPSQSGAAIVPTLEPDRLVMTGSVATLQRAADLVAAIDKPRPVVEIRAVVFEVRTSKARGSALSILANALGGKVQLGSYPDLAPGGQFVRIASGGLKAVLSAVKEDARFNVVAEPSLAATSGSSASINSGSQVPTLGAVTVSENSGTPTRSIVYRDSGVSLTVAPTVRLGEIQMVVTQERSTFVKTTTGVDDSPTLNKSSASASVSIAPGETIAIAGLDERSDVATKRGLLGGLLGAKSNDQTQSQLLLLVQADIADSDKREAKPKFERIGPAEKSPRKPVERDKAKPGV